jgi:hypothetical protein
MLRKRSIAAALLATPDFQAEMAPAVCSDRDGEPVAAAGSTARAFST